MIFSNLLKKQNKILENLTTIVIKSYITYIWKKFLQSWKTKSYIVN